MQLSKHSKCHLDACRHTTQMHLHPTLTRDVSCSALPLHSLQGRNHLLHATYVWLVRHSSVSGEQFCQVNRQRPKEAKDQKRTLRLKACIWSLLLTEATKGHSKHRVCQTQTISMSEENTEVGNDSLSILSCPSTLEKNFLSAFVHGK